jgi:predicted MarR family transcription regulator
LCTVFLDKLPTKRLDNVMEEKQSKRKIVSSRHLATEGGWQLSEFEFGLMIAHNGFSRWVNHCMAAAGNADLGTLEILVLHNITHRSRSKRLADVCFMLNMEDTHTVNYALKKLVKHGLVAGEKSGKEILYSATEQGIELCGKYREVREQCLVDGLTMHDSGGHDLSEIAASLRALSGVYDQASRAASSL